MPPSFRSSRSGRQFADSNANRTRTGQVDHDVFEGLPVRRWARQTYTFSQTPKSEESDNVIQSTSGNQPLPEPPMPRDSQLLSPMSRALLRAARAGCVYIRHANKEVEDDEKEATDAEDSAVLRRTERTFTARKWTAIARNVEPPEVEFLAKRRPGLPSLYGALAGAANGVAGGTAAPMRKTKFKKVDPVTGNISVYEAWVPEGHKLEGEIAEDAPISAEISSVAGIPEMPAPGTVVEGVGVVNENGVVVAEAGSVAVVSPLKRRPPPPKRKGKGIGRGRRKKVMFAPGEGVNAVPVPDGGARTADGSVDVDLVKGEDGESTHVLADQSGQDDDEEGDEGDDGDESDESDDGNETMVDSNNYSTRTVSRPAVDSAANFDAEPGGVPIVKPASGPTTDGKPASSLPVSVSPLASNSPATPAASLEHNDQPSGRTIQPPLGADFPVSKSEGSTLEETTFHFSKDSQEEPIISASQPAATEPLETEMDMATKQDCQRPSEVTSNHPASPPPRRSQSLSSSSASDPIYIPAVSPAPPSLPTPILFPDGEQGREGNGGRS